MLLGGFPGPTPAVCDTTPNGSVGTSGKQDTWVGANAESFSGEMVLQQLKLSNLPPGAQGNLMITADN